MFLLSIILQWHSGAWKSDFGGHADEASHVVTSLMVRDYLSGGFLEEWHPIRYAEGYYEQFPKVAIGHYPPGFYVLAGIFLIPVRSPGAMLAVMALLSAGAGWMTWRVGREILQGASSPLLIAALFCSLPLIRTYTSIVMSDLLLLIFLLGAAHEFLRFLETGRARYSLGFGFLAALAILTKGSGLCLALVPIVSLMIVGRWDLLRRWRLWVAPIPVLLLAFPWMWLTREITAEGMSGVGGFEHFRSAIPYFGLAMGKEIGWVASGILGLSGVIGVGSRLFGSRGRKERPPSPGEAVMWALMLGVVVLAVSIPAGLDHRYLMPLIPAALILAADFLQKKPGSHSRLWLKLVVPLLVVTVIFETWRTVEKRFTGASSAIASVFSDSKASQTSGRSRILVVSSPGGEGALTAAAAFLSPGSLEIRRGSRILAKSDWLGRKYEIGFETPVELESLLSKFEIDYVVFDQPGADGVSVPDHWSSLVDIFALPGEKVNQEFVSEHLSHRKHGGESVFSVYRIQVEASTGPSRDEIVR